MGSSGQKSAESEKPATEGQGTTSCGSGSDWGSWRGGIFAAVEAGVMLASGWMCGHRWELRGERECSRLGQERVGL